MQGNGYTATPDSTGVAVCLVLPHLDGHCVHSKREDQYAAAMPLDPEQKREGLEKREKLQDQLRVAEESLKKTQAEQPESKHGELLERKAEAEEATIRAIKDNLVLLEEALRTR